MEIDPGQVALLDGTVRSGNKTWFTLDLPLLITYY